MHDAITQVDERQARQVRFSKRASSRLSVVRGPNFRGAAASSSSFKTQSGFFAAPLFEAVAAGRLHTIGACARPLGRMNLRLALRGGRRPGDLLNGKQDAYRRDPPRGD
ncbi:MAG TPA: hypothetical protein VGN05_10385, partial [Parvibaculum sp.]